MKSETKTKTDATTEKKPATKPKRPKQKKPRRPNFIKRWLQRRAARRLKEEHERRVEEERRMDALLEKISREGKDSLTGEEQRFLDRVSQRYRTKPPEENDSPSDW